VLWVSQEESYGSAVLPRLCHAGFTQRSIYCVDNFRAGDGQRLYLPGGAQYLAGLLESINCGCVVIDPVGAIADPGIQFKEEQQVRHYLESLKYVAQYAKCTIILPRHIRKGKGGNLLDAGLHSVAIVNVARSVLRVDPHPDESGDFVLSTIASNHGAKRLPLRYSLCGAEGDVATVAWKREEELSEEEIADGLEEKHEREEFEDAKKLLGKSIAGGEQLATLLIAEARKASISERTLRKAKAALSVVSVRRGGGTGGEAAWYWRFPSAPKGG
jgi:hypothetical protein